MTGMMPTRCPECGAALNPERACQDVFNEFLALEFTDPGYGEVHFLTVACYMIQHGQYSPAGLAWIEQKLRDHLQNGLPVAQIRAQAQGEASQSARRWKVTRAPGDPPQRKIDWTVTIMDVAESAGDAASYRARVREWAAATLREMRPLLEPSA